MTARRRHRQHGNPFNVRGTIAPLDREQVFGRVAPLALDIGFGAGGFTLELARRQPDWDVIGLEIRSHLVDRLNRAAGEAGLPNLVAVLANVNAHLADLIPDRSLRLVSLNFPDPWFKKRHHKRRVVQPDWAKTLIDKLAAAGEIHATTDFGPLGAAMLEIFESQPELENIAGAGCFAPRSTTGILSEREQTHLHRDVPIYRLHFRRRNQRS